MALLRRPPQPRFDVGDLENVPRNVPLRSAEWPKSFKFGAPAYVLVTDCGDVVPLELVFWPGDGTNHRVTGSRSLRNYRRADSGALVLAVDVPRVRADGSECWPEVDQ